MMNAIELKEKSLKLYKEVRDMTLELEKHNNEQRQKIQEIKEQLAETNKILFQLEALTAKANCEDCVNQRGRAPEADAKVGEEIVVKAYRCSACMIGTILNFRTRCEHYRPDKSLVDETVSKKGDQ
jgi:hypothetical protein